MLFDSNEKGQKLVEYALVLALVAIVVIAVLIILGSQWTVIIASPYSKWVVVALVVVVVFVFKHLV